MPYVVSTLVKTMLTPMWKLVFSIQHVEANITLRYLWRNRTFGWEFLQGCTQAERNDKLRRKKSREFIVDSLTTKSPIELKCNSKQH